MHRQKVYIDILHMHGWVGGFVVIKEDIQKSYRSSPLSRSRIRLVSLYWFSSLVFFRLYHTHLKNWGSRVYGTWESKFYILVAVLNIIKLDLCLIKFSLEPPNEICYQYSLQR
jgi:hypothetical protein